MIREDKEMIAGCIDEMRQGGCAGCPKQDPCARMFPEALRFMLGSRRPARKQEWRRGSAKYPFLTFLGEVAKAVEARAAERPAKPLATRFRAEVERQLEPRLASGEIGIEQVARDLGYSRQTLYRRLKSEGVTYEQLLDSLRRRLALKFVREQGLSVKDAAYRLGFSDPAAFSRAFKRWTGTSPGGTRRPR
jgi:AraC-like DNA-binding protein